VATILVVDDEEPIREALRLFLQLAGHRVLEAIHGGDALKLLERERPDLVISDVMMPVMDGLELARRLKATTTIPVILTSAAGPPGAEYAEIEAFVPKPFVMQELEQLVQRLLVDAGA
jgi:two-component system chemotaxis response regulator CheY